MSGRRRRKGASGYHGRRVSSRGNRRRAALRIGTHMWKQMKTKYNWATCDVNAILHRRRPAQLMQNNVMAVRPLSDGSIDNHF